MNWKRTFFVVLLLIITSLTLASCLWPDTGKPKKPKQDNIMDRGENPPPATATVPPTLVPTASPPEVPFYQFVPGGAFVMGSREDDPLAGKDELPEKSVQLPGYWIFTDEVTNELYALCVEAGDCTLPAAEETGPKSRYADPEFEKFPVVGVTWFQADEFCRFQDAHLPTEAEWEKAARGFFGNTYPWGNDEPVCDLANINGCEKNTARVGSYDDGISPFEVRDMAGNVREWVADWYKADAYIVDILFMPMGPETGEKKVVRGGGYLDSARDNRSSARFAYDPELEFDDVGFRCVPNSLTYAPFCSTTYKNFCSPPQTGDTPQDDCQPFNLQGDPIGIKTSISCPQNGSVTIIVTTSEPAGNVTWNGNPCTWVAENQFSCQVPASETDIGATIDGTVCASETGNAFNPNFGFHPVTCENYSIPVSIGDTITLAEAYANPYFLTGAGFITRQLPSPGCPTGYTWDPQKKECLMDNLVVVNPEPGTEGMCPEGYVLDPNLLCCVPGTEDNGGCEDGFYMSAAAQLCIPIQENGCPAGWIYDPYKGCLQPVHQEEEPNGCPDGMHLMSDGKTCEVDHQEGNLHITCPPGSEYVPGKGCETSVSESQITIFSCNEGYYYDSKAQGCVQLSQDGCMAGTYFDPDLKQCLPTTGPWTGCPQNYVLNVRTGCCVPVPGTDNTDCFGGTNGQGPTPVPGIPNNQNGWDPGSSICPPPSEDACPPGYIRIEAEDKCVIINECPPGTGPTPNNPNGCFPQGNEPCPQGYEMTNTGQGCVSTAMITYIVCDPGYHSNDNATECLPDEGCPPGTGPTPNNPNGCYPPGNEPCPQGYEMSSTGQGCIMIQTGGLQSLCAPSQYWDSSMGICLDLTDDCCAQGYYFDVQFKQCLPIPMDQNCPLGYYFDGQSCQPFVQQYNNCTAFTLTIPACTAQCPSGTHWDVDQQKCVTDNPCQGVNCSAYANNPTACRANPCCEVTVSGAGCVRK